MTTLAELARRTADESPPTVASIHERAQELIWLTRIFDKTEAPQWMWTGSSVGGPDDAWLCTNLRHTDGRAMTLRYPALKKYKTKVREGKVSTKVVETDASTAAVTQADLNLAAAAMDVIDHDNREVFVERLRRALSRYEFIEAAP